MSQSALLKSKKFGPFFLTQFLGAFNDNIFKNVLLLMVAFSASKGLDINLNIFVNLAAGLFILPFFLFSAIAGQVTDKYEKSGLIRKIKFLEIIIMGAAAVALVFELYYLLLVLLFLMGAQSTFFGPAKYSILPQHLHPDQLVGGNALVEMGTFVAILVGTIGAGIIMQFDGYAGIAAFAVVLVAVLGYIASRGIPVAEADCPEIKVSLNPVSSTLSIVRTIRGDRPSFLAIAAISWFWFLGASYLTQFPNFTKEVLGGDTSVVTLLLTVFTLGIGIGSMACEKLSQSRVELGIVPIGALGLTLFGFDLFLSSPSSPAINITWLAFLDQPHAWRLIIDLLGIGISGGIFIVPLYAYIQLRAPVEFRARTIAVVNIMNALYMVGSAIAGIILLGIMELSIPHFFAVLAIMNLVVCGYVFYKVDEFALRFIAWILSNLMYRVKKVNLDFIPKEGPAVMVCNHVSYVDALLLLGASPRPVHFVMDHNIFKMPVLGWLFRQVKAIPVASKHVDERLYTEAFERVSASLQDGNLVCIFPEGKLTKNGEINEFKTGIEKIIERDPVPVIPMALIGLWGSFFSHKDGTALAKVPRRFWSRVTMKAATPIAPEQVTATHLQKVVTELVNGQV